MAAKHSDAFKLETSQRYQFMECWQTSSLLDDAETRHAFDDFRRTFVKPDRLATFEKLYQGVWKFECFHHHEWIPHRALVSDRPEHDGAISVRVIYRSGSNAAGWRLVGANAPWHRVFVRPGPAFALVDAEPTIAIFDPHGSDGQVLRLRTLAGRPR